MKDFKAPVKKRGRVKKGEIDKCQTIYWAWTVRKKLGLDFAKIERKLNSGCASKRDDGGGYTQPQLWRKYGCGSVSPSGNGHSGGKLNAVISAEKCAEGTYKIYNSALWRFLRLKKISIAKTKQICEEMDSEVTKCLRSCQPQAKSILASVRALNTEAMGTLANIFHLDVMAVFLIHMKLEPWSRHDASVFARRWLQNIAGCDPAFAKVEGRLITVLVNFEPRLRTPIPLPEIRAAIRPKRKSAVTFLTELLRGHEDCQ